MSLATNITDLAQAVANAVKQDRTWINGNTANLAALQTTVKTNLVAAINEVNAAVASATGIDDNTTSSSSTWSSSQITAHVVAELASAVDGLAVIDDDTTDPGSTWSSNKIADVIAAAVTDAIDDTSTSTDTTWSSSKTATEITDARAGLKAELLGGADPAFDTLRELQDAYEDNQDAITALTTALGNRVRYDDTQTLTGPQQAQARSNIGAAAAADVGDTTTNFVTVFTNGLV